MRVLGIHFSPIKKGNTAFAFDVALGEASQASDVSSECIALSRLTIADYKHCNWCISKQTPERLCLVEDDASPILEKIRDCDVLILASPV